MKNMGSENKDLKTKTMSGMIWRFAERCGAQGVSFIVSIVLARLLSPDDYGLIALVTVFITISQVFVDSGLGNALVQKKDADNLDFSSVFYFNILVCFVIYAVIWAVSPLIAYFYDSSELTAVLRVLGLTIIISSLKNVQQAYVSKKMMFKRFFFATLGGTLIAAAIGIAMAYLGFGVWALVAQQLMNLMVDTAILWVTVKWRPILQFSLSRLKGLFSYGWKLLLSSLVDTVYSDIRQLIIGKMYSSSDLAYYNRGRQIPNMVVGNINSSIDSVLLPAMASVQDTAGSVKAMTRRAIKTSSYIMWPMMAGLAVITEPLTRLLLTEKWIESIPYAQIFCLTFAFQPIHTANLNAIKAMGRSDLFLKLEIIKKTIGLVLLLIAMRYGVFAIAFSSFIYNFIAQILNSSPNRKLLDYRYIEQMKDILPYIGLAAVMAAAIYPVAMTGMPDILVIALQVFLGAVVYVGGSVLFKIDSFQYVMDMVKKMMKKNR